MTHILLVEDNPIDARLMHRMFQELKEWPTSITWISDGEKALCYLRSLEAGGVPEPPEVVLLDFNLPKYSGLDILAVIRKEMKLWNLPVFLLSSSPAEALSNLAEGRQLKADGYYEKPFGLAGFEAIARTIRKHCEQLARSAAA